MSFEAAFGTLPMEVNQMDLIPLENELSLQRQWRRCDQLARRYGMRLTRGQFEHLAQARRQVLQDTGRIDFGGGVLDQLV